MNDAGQVAFVATVVHEPGAEPVEALFVPGPRGDPVHRLRVGGAAPGIAGGRIESLEPRHLAPDGAMLVQTFATIGDPFWRAATYRFSRGEPVLLVRTDDPFRGVTQLAYDSTLTRFAAIDHALLAGTLVVSVPEADGAVSAAAVVAALAAWRGRRRRRVAAASTRRDSSSSSGFRARQGLLCTLLAVLLFGSLAPALASPWSKIAAEGEDAPEGRLYGPLILGSWIADDGSVSFAEAPPDPLQSPPAFRLWRWSQASGAGLVAALGGSALDTWARPELFSNAAGDLALREGSGPAPVECGEEGTSEQVRERLHAVPREGASALVAATGAPAPGASDLTVARLLQTKVIIGGHSEFVFHFGPPSIDPGGEPTFYAQTADDPCFLDEAVADLPGAVFAPDGAGGTALVARAGDPLPDGGESEVIRLGVFGAFERVAVSETVFLSSALGELVGRGEPLISALLRWRPGSPLETVVRPGTPSPFAGGVTFADTDLPASSPSGAIALVARRATGDGTTPDPDGRAIWIGDADGVTETWPLAGAVPGGPDGAVFLEELAERGIVFFGHRVRVNDAAEVAFAAPIRLAPEAEATVGLFGPDANGAPTLRLVVGASAPGGLTFQSFDPLHLAEDGTLLVRAQLSGPPVESFMNTGWYLLPRDGGPRLLLRLSDEIEIAPGDFRRPSFFPETLTHDAALGRFAMRFGRAGEPTAIAVSTVPEPFPSLASASAYAGLGLLASRRRARWPIRSGCRMRRSCDS